MMQLFECREPSVALMPVERKQIDAVSGKNQFDSHYLFKRVAVAVNQSTGKRHELAIGALNVERDVRLLD